MYWAFSSFPFISEVGIYIFILSEWNFLIKERCNKARQGKYNAMKQIGTEHVSSQIDRDDSSPHLAASTHHPVGGRHLAKLLKKGNPWWGEEGWWRWRDNWRRGGRQGPCGVSATVGKLLSVKCLKPLDGTSFPGPLSSSFSSFTIPSCFFSSFTFCRFDFSLGEAVSS